MHPSAPRTAALARSLVLSTAIAGGCFADPGPVGSGDDETGTTGTTTTTASDDSTGTPTTGGPGECGNSQLDDGEACDNGPSNGQNGASCKPDCTLNVCGDGYLAASEGCDDGNIVDDDGCDNSCKLTGCGDGKPGPGEQCDDGNDVDDDGCSNLCKLPSCGDAVVQADEECDLGRMNGDDQQCTLACKLAVCGDGEVLVGVEECDDGNQDATDACSNMCTLASCGDAILQPGEDCDDGNTVDDDGCSNSCEALCGNGIVDPGETCDDGNILDDDTCGATCQRTAFLVFVTSQKFSGNLGGVQGANSKCNVLATAAGLPGAGKYRAWLSSDTDAPFDSFFQSNLPYRRPDGTLVADSWSDLVSGGLGAPISVSETGVSIGGGANDCSSLDKLVWTNTGPAGTLDNEAHCDGWTVAQALIKGGAGNLGNINFGWTDLCQLGCSSMARLYCFEQP